RPTPRVVAGPAAPKSTASASRQMRFVSSGTGEPDAEIWGGVRIVSGTLAPLRTSHVASTTSMPIPSPGSATTVFMGRQYNPAHENPADRACPRLDRRQ